MTVQYESSRQRRKRGLPRHALLPDYDAPILAELPVEGTKMGKIKPLAPSAKHISQRLDGELTPVEVDRRLSAMEYQGAVVRVIIMPIAGGPGWQITTKGQEILRQMKAGEYVG